MNDADIQNLNTDEVIEDALRTAPLETPPPHLYAGVMRQVHAQSTLPRFQIPWIDFALALFAGAMICVIAELLLFVPPQWTQSIYLNWLKLAQLNTHFYLGVWMVGAALLGSAALLTAVFVLRRR
jgi:hypothetical protein